MTSLQFDQASAHVLFAGGASGGHLFPGLAVAARLRRMLPAVQISFAGRGRRFEREQLAAAGFPLAAVPCHPLPANPWQVMQFAAHNLAGFMAARWLLIEKKVSLVVGLGSFASVPVVRAASALGIPALLLEANVVPGRATRFLAPTASLVCGAFAEAKFRLPLGTNYRLTGTPVRAGFLKPRRPRCGSRQTLPAQTPARRLIVLGGSSGAAMLNAAVPVALARPMDASPVPWQVIHQAGSGQVDTTQSHYDRLGLDAVVVSFVDNLPYLLRDADLVITRAGGATLAELACLGIPAILVPYPRSADGHQQANAEAACSAGGCRVVEEQTTAHAFSAHLADALGPLLADREEREVMSACWSRLARPSAAEEVAHEIARLLARSNRRRAA